MGYPRSYAEMRCFNMKCVTKMRASYLSSKFKHVKRAKTAQLRAKAHDYLKKTPRLGSQSILPSTSFALAQQASSREYSKSLTKDDDDDESHGGSRTEKTPHGSSQIKNTTAHSRKKEKSRLLLPSTRNKRHLTVDIV